MSFEPQDIEIAPVRASWSANTVTLHVLRLDKVHPVVSGNKWFKLQGFVQRARSEDKDCLLTFGGAYSNHLLATSALCSELGMSSIGIVRGEKPPQLSKTLEDARAYGMSLYFVSREAYRARTIPEPCLQYHNSGEVLVVDEGGYGIDGRKGIEALFRKLPLESYTHIAVATGTGTTLAGIVAATRQQEVIGISPFRNNHSLPSSVNALLPPALHDRFRLVDEYHFGGFAKAPAELLLFMNEWYEHTRLPTDIVYTGKLFYALQAMANDGAFPPGSRILAVHTGGLQGNRSLEKGTLIFEGL